MSFTFYAPNLPNLPFLPLDPPMQQENPQPWQNPGEDPAVQEMLAQPWVNPGDDPAVQEMTAQPWVSAGATEATSAMANVWGVYDQSGNPVFDVDSCVDFKFSDNAKVSDFPVEQGAFASYNKVASPFQPKVKLAVGGQQRIGVFLAALSASVRSTEIYNVFTPEANYLGVTLEKYDYTRTAAKGRNLLVVELTLMQVVQVSVQYTSVKLPPAKVKNASSADAANGGKAQAKNPPDPLPRSVQIANAKAEIMGRS